MTQPEKAIRDQLRSNPSLSANAGASAAPWTSAAKSATRDRPIGFYGHEIGHA
jgi:hypothetical protein